MMRVGPSTTIADILDRHPAAIRVFLAHRMACVGCAVAPYHTIEEVCADYSLSFDRLKRELATAVKR